MVPEYLDHSKECHEHEKLSQKATELHNQPQKLIKGITEKQLGREKCIDYLELLLSDTELTPNLGIG